MDSHPSDTISIPRGNAPEEYVASRTIIKSASVKVMLSYNYNHFESSMTLENPMGVTLEEIDEARKNLNRLNNKAIKQYKEAKEAADRREQSAYLRAEFKAQCERILKKPEEERTAEQKAQLKQYQDEDWENQFDFDYDFEDDDEDWAPWGQTIERSVGE